MKVAPGPPLVTPEDTDEEAESGHEATNSPSGSERTPQRRSRGRGSGGLKLRPPGQPGRSKPAPPGLLRRSGQRRTHSGGRGSSRPGGRPQTGVPGTSCDPGHRTWNRSGPLEPGGIPKDAPPQPGGASGRHGDHSCRATGLVRGTASRDRVRGHVSHGPAPNRPHHFLLSAASLERSFP